MIIKTYCFFSAITVALVTSSIRAELPIGAKPAMRFEVFGSKANVDIAQFRGQYVLIDFWATWCGPCIKSMPALKALHAKYHDKGLVVIGISKDQAPAPLADYIRAEQIPWIQVYDDMPNHKFGDKFDVRGIPHAILLDPEGTVIWTGHAARADGEVERRFSASPPPMVDSQTMASVNAMLTEAAAQSDAGEFLKALDKLKNIPSNALVNGELKLRHDQVRSGIDAQGNSMLAKVEQLISEKKFVEGVEQLKTISQSFKGTEISKAASKRIDQLMADESAREVIRQGDDARKASEQLAQADALKARGKHELAYDKYKLIAKVFVQTPAGEKAAQAVATYDADETFAKKEISKDTGDKARSLLSLARTYASGQMHVKARAKYQEIIDKYPDTEWSRISREEMAKLK